jgi:hypothetical protein
MQSAQQWSAFAAVDVLRETHPASLAANCVHARHAARHPESAIMFIINDLENLLCPRLHSGWPIWG